ncbi:MAG: hypothetical protein ACRDB1_13560 [Microcoleaceae cyanobacterium]
MKKHLIFSTIILNSSLIFSISNIQTLAQENPGCFMVNSSEELINLNNICTPDKIPDEPVIVDGIQLIRTGLLLNGSEVPVISGTLKNLTDERVILNNVNFQLEDTKTGDVVTSLSISLSIELKPGQTGEFRKPLSSIVDLGDRTAKELDIVFFSWD